MKKTKKLIIVGNSSFSEIAFEYFEYDSEFKVVGFGVEKDFLKSSSHLNLPNLPFEEIENYYDPSEHYVYVATVYTQLNRLRSRLAFEAKCKGFKLASYISPNAFVWSNVKIGEHCFIFENNTLQPFVEIQDNVVLWSGNHIGHHSLIRNNCFLSSHVVISGHCDIGENAFFGVNSTVANNIVIASDNFISMGTSISKKTDEDGFYSGNPAEKRKVSAKRLCKVKE